MDPAGLRMRRDLARQQTSGGERAAESARRKRSSRLALSDSQDQITLRYPVWLRETPTQAPRPRISMAFLLPLALFALAPQSAEAQQRFDLGIRGGPNLASVASSAQQFSSRTGFSAGLSVTYRINRAHDLQIVPVYTQKGFTTNDQVTPGTDRRDQMVTVRALDYVQLGIRVRRLIGTRIQGPGLQLFGGPFAAVRVSCTIASSGFLEVPRAQCAESDSRFRPRQMDFGVVAGLGVRLPPMFAIEVEYAHSLTPLITDWRVGSSGIWNRAWNLGFSIHP